MAALFAQGGDPKRCGCMWWRMTNQEWQTSSPQQRHEQLRGLATGSGPPGLVGLLGDEAAAWVNVAPIPELSRLQRSRTLPTPGGTEDVWAIVCLVVGKAHRGQGLTVQMVEAAVAHAATSGASTVVGYPIDTAGDRIASANAYTGTLSMFRDCGFDVVAATTSNAGGRPRVMVERRVS